MTIKAVMYTDGLGHRRVVFHHDPVPDWQKRYYPGKVVESADLTEEDERRGVISVLMNVAQEQPALSLAQLLEMLRKTGSDTCTISDAAQAAWLVYDLLCRDARADAPAVIEFLRRHQLYNIAIAFRQRCEAVQSST